MFSGLNDTHAIETVVEEDTPYILPAIGEYKVLSLDNQSPISIATLGDDQLAEKIAELKPEGISIVGKIETENIGVEKIIQNVIATPSIRYLILCGKDSEGHYSGDTLRALVENGVDANMKVIDCKGRKPVLSNVSKEEINIFRDQIEVVDMIGCENVDEILAKSEQLLKKWESNGGCETVQPRIDIQAAEIVNAKEKDPKKVRLDKAGYFVIVPKADTKEILVEHYSNANKLLRVIKGTNARNIYWTIIENEWVTELSHAAYLGKELTHAEVSMKLGTKYIQDKA